MPKEIERRFLVDEKKLPPLGRGKHYAQGYLSTAPVVRVRVIENVQGKLTIKGPTLHRTRDEFEYSIPAEEAKAMLALCKAKLSKTRFQFGRWEIDRFDAPLDGLWLAECELDREDEPLPEAGPWLGQEVTNDGGYSNASLATNGLPKP